MTRFRLTTQWLMILVAIIGVSLGTTIFIRKVVIWRRLCLYKAEMYELQRGLRLMSYEEDTSKYGFDPYLFEQCQRRVEHHARMRKKWEHAADHPFTSVSTDPPEPQ
jgi:hypothetical protein